MTNQIAKREMIYARVSIVAAQSGKIDEVRTVYRDSIVPALKKQKGFKGYYVLTDAIQASV